MTPQHVRSYRYITILERGRLNSESEDIKYAEWYIHLSTNFYPNTKIRNT